MCVKWTRILGYIWYAHSRSSSFSACMLIGHLLWEVPMRSDEKKKSGARGKEHFNESWRHEQREAGPLLFYKSPKFYEQKPIKQAMSLLKI